MDFEAEQSETAVHCLLLGPLHARHSNSDAEQTVQGMQAPSGSRYSRPTMHGAAVEVRVVARTVVVVVTGHPSILVEPLKHFVTHSIVAPRGQFDHRQLAGEGKQIRTGDRAR